MSTTTAPISTAARFLFDRSAITLAQAQEESDPGQRYLLAHLAALRAGSAVLAVRTRPGGRGGPRGAWEVLPRWAPELGEWASYFASTGERRAAIDAGVQHRAPTAQEADDLLADAEAFGRLARMTVGMEVAS